MRGERGQKRDDRRERTEDRREMRGLEGREERVQCPNLDHGSYRYQRTNRHYNVPVRTLDKSAHLWSALTAIRTDSEGDGTAERVFKGTYSFSASYTIMSPSSPAVNNNK